MSLGILGLFTSEQCLWIFLLGNIDALEFASGGYIHTPIPSPMCKQKTCGEAWLVNIPPYQHSVQMYGIGCLPPTHVAGSCGLSPES